MYMVEVIDKIVKKKINSKYYPPWIAKGYSNWRARVQLSDLEQLMHESEHLHTSTRWSARLNKAYRVIFELLDDKIVVVKGVTKHRYNHYV